MISQRGSPIKNYDGTPYENTDDCWEGLLRASRDARLLGLVPPDAFDDRRNKAPVEYLPNFNEPLGFSIDSNPVFDPPELELIDDQVPPLVDRPIERLTILGLSSPPDELKMSEVQPPDAPEPAELPEPPEITFSAPLNEPPWFHLEIWCEKTTINYVLEPLAQEYNLNLLTGTGFQSLTQCLRLVERAKRSRRPVLIFYISDFDPAGRAMPCSVARTIEFLAWRDGNTSH
jgi:hypothetical protein